MNLRLQRLQARADGIFSDLFDDQGELLAQTLEHAYEQENASWQAKIPCGTYTCRRGLHRLHGMAEPFETFEVLGVPGCAGILFHWGNFDRDSEGCILLGNHIARAEDGSQMVTDSRKAFGKFMVLQGGIDEFTLTVE